MTTNNLLASLLASYSAEQLKEAAWENATPIGDGSYLRMDCDGRYIRKPDHGQHSYFGWEIDHIVRKCFGGRDVPSNVRARHHFGNAQDGGFTAAALANVHRHID
jgi:hypothetical protein